MKRSRQLRDPVTGEELTPPRRHGLILRSIAVAPAICTLLNGLCGFASIYMASWSGDVPAKLSYPMGDFAIAAWLIFAAMVFDMLDGRLARWARKTTEFGAQLDSLCDAISFGVAPAFLMLRTVVAALHHENIARLNFPDMVPLERAVWCVAAIYVSCTVLRLARFNVENEPDESAHMYFRGLPSPGAAALVASLVLLLVRLNGVSVGWRSNPILLGSIVLILPTATLLAALLMVSRFKYPHVINRFIRGKKPFSYLIKIIIILLAGVLDLSVTAAAVCLFYALWGPVGWMMRRRQVAPATPPPPQQQ